MLSQGIEGLLKSVKEAITQVKELTPKDRMEMVTACFQCNGQMLAVSQGWAALLSNPQLINQFDKEVLAQFFEKFQKISIDFLEFGAWAAEQLMLLEKAKTPPKPPDWPQQERTNLPY